MLRHVLALATSSPWAITPRYAEIVREILMRRTNGWAIDSAELDRVHEKRAAVEAQRASDSAASRGSVAVVPILGTLMPRASMMDEQSGATSPEAIGAMIDRAAADPSVKTILLDINSPGGNVQGIAECAAKIRAARSTKQVVAVANYDCHSAAYRLAAEADEIVASTSADLGSIGAIAIHRDESGAMEQKGIKLELITAGKYKAEGYESGPLSTSARTELQGRVDAVYAEMTAGIAKGRGVPVATVRGPRFGEGRSFLAVDAVERGLADRVATFEETLARFQSGGRVTARAAATSIPLVVTMAVKADEVTAADVKPGIDAAYADAIDDLDLRERELETI